MLVKIHAGHVIGVKAIPVSIEVNIGQGSKYYIVGLPGSAIRESFQRIEAALRNNGMHMPRQKIVVNLAPADLRKEGSSYDLSIACGILAASGQLDPGQIQKYMIMGELSLDGSLMPVRGILPLAIQALDDGLQGFILPESNDAEANVLGNLDILGLKNISELINYFSATRSRQSSLSAATIKKTSFPKQPYANHLKEDFSNVKGHASVKRALEVAAAGGHNILMIGSPGSGKTMLAHCLPGILPDLDLKESIQTSSIHSVSGMMAGCNLINRAPFRAPHHTITEIAMAGGGNELRPGEISLAHHGILFLDELPEFRQSALEVLRQPMEEGCIRITRSRNTVEYPASFMLLAAMNPCPCGNLGHPEKECSCAPGVVQRYISKISGPLLDRIDIHLEVSPLSFDELTGSRQSETSAEIRKRVIKAREIQKLRFELNSKINEKDDFETDFALHFESGFAPDSKTGFTAKPEQSFTAKPEQSFTAKPESSFLAKPEQSFTAKPETSFAPNSLTGFHPIAQTNSKLDRSMIRRYCQTDKACTALLKLAMERLNLSARAYYRILRVARTIADLDNSENIKTVHVAEAIQYRTLDRGSRN